VRIHLAASLDDCFGIVLIDDELCWSRFRLTKLLVSVSYSSSVYSVDGEFSSEEFIFVFVQFEL
jgi:hypothetical protein